MPVQRVGIMAVGNTIDTKSSTPQAVRTPKPDQSAKMDHIETTQNNTMRKIPLSEMLESNSGSQNTNTWKASQRDAASGSSLKATSGGQNSNSQLTDPVQASYMSYAKHNMANMAPLKMTSEDTMMTEHSTPHAIKTPKPEQSIKMDI